MTPEELRAWRSVLRDFLLLGCGVFLLLFATLTVRDPAILTILLGAGLTCVGVPPMLRLDERVRATDEEQK